MRSSTSQLHLGLGVRLFFGLVLSSRRFHCASSVEAAPLNVQLFAPPRLIDGRGEARAETFVKHPWPIKSASQDIGKDKEEEQKETRTRDGVEFKVDVVPEALPADVRRGLYVGLFSVSFTSTEAKVEQWLHDGNLPPSTNPLRMWTLFSHQYPDGIMQPDELGDACIGEAFRAEFCVRVASCLTVIGNEGRGGGSWRVAVTVPYASNYRFEAYLGDYSPACKHTPSHETKTKSSGRRQMDFTWWAPLVSEHVAPSRSAFAMHAAYTHFRLLYVNQANFWWGHEAAVDPITCWTEMMSAAVETASYSIAASASKLGLPMAASAPDGLWLEFGVGSGKSTAAIATWLKSLRAGATLHGFDSFQGLPSSWVHTKLDAGTFSTGGVVPEHLLHMDNVQVHVGLFADTLAELDVFGITPVAFAHVDVDIYPSAVEVLSKIACQLYPGTVLVFDEFMNYAGFELSGEFRAWEYISIAYRIRWEYAGSFWQQAVPIIITERAEIC